MLITVAYAMKGKLKNKQTVHSVLPPTPQGKTTKVCLCVCLCVCERVTNSACRCKLAGECSILYNLAWFLVTWKETILMLCHYKENELQHTAVCLRASVCLGCSLPQSN